MDRDQLLEELETSRDAVLAAFDCPREFWDSSYAPGKWTVRQILTHIADTELVYYLRFSKAVAEPGTAVEAFDENAWARLEAATRSPSATRAMFDAVREALISRLRGLDDAALERTVAHPERGALSARAILGSASKHGPHHAGQVLAVRDGKPWQPPV
ncbi:MAG: DinB family protein [Candidatus Sumerlaeia bacterium]|nr:DinB family protein [Candidatus Sumerlaeia bacterium]